MQSVYQRLFTAHELNRTNSSLRTGELALAISCVNTCIAIRHTCDENLVAFRALRLLVGRQEGHPACKKLSGGGAGVVICLELGADLHMAQLMPLPLTVSCFSKIQIGFTFLVPAHPGSPGNGPLNVCVCVCVHACVYAVKIIRISVDVCRKYSMLSQCRFGEHSAFLALCISDVLISNVHIFIW